MDKIMKFAGFTVFLGSIVGGSVLGKGFETNGDLGSQSNISFLIVSVISGFIFMMFFLLLGKIIWYQSMILEDIRLKSVRDKEEYEKKRYEGIKNGLI